MQGTWRVPIALAVLGVGVASVPTRLAWGAAADSEPGAPQPRPEVEPATFEALLRTAAPTADWDTLLAPFTGKCDDEKRELDRVRCRVTNGYLRRTIPKRAFSTLANDPMVIGVSDFDAAVKGYHLSIAGCLACTHPLTVAGRSNESRLLTLKTPDPNAASLAAAVEVSRNSVGFDSLADAKAWLQQSLPELRTQFVFRPAETEWTFGARRGYAMTLLGLRVFNRCTGEVLISRPPSAAVADLPPGMTDGCHDRDRETAAEDRQPDRQNQADAKDVPDLLSKRDISDAMDAIRPRVFACFERFKVPGLAQYDFVVAASGAVTSLRLAGAFSGTPTGACLVEAAGTAHFRRTNARELQHFTYPFFLRP